MTFPTCVFYAGKNAEMKKGIVNMQKISVRFRYRYHTENENHMPLDSYRNFIKYTLFGTYFINKPFTEVNIHPSEVNFSTFFLQK